MKTGYKKKLIHLLANVLIELDPRFSPITVDGINDIAVFARPHVKSKDWYFVAICFARTEDRFFLEVGFNISPNWPSEVLPDQANTINFSKAWRIRVQQLWSNSNWNIGWSLGDPNSEEGTAKGRQYSDGVFSTPEAAILNVRERLNLFVLPFIAKREMV